MTTKGVVAVQHRKYVDCRKGLVVPKATQENLKTAFQIVAVDLLLLSAQGRTTPVIQPFAKMNAVLGQVFPCFPLSRPVSSAGCKSH